MNNHESGFSLVEIAIVLLIIGVIIGGVLKGQDLIESAKIKATIQQINEYKMASASFADRYSALPGDYAQASHDLGAEIPNGNGDGIIEPDMFWQQLAAAKLVSTPTAPDAKIGGKITVTYQHGNHWFVLHTTPQQALAIDKNLDNGDPASGNVRSESIANDNSCVQDGHYNTTNTDKVCKVLIRF